MFNVLLAVAIAAGAFPPPTRAECVLLKPVTVARAAAAVFSGTVTGIDSATITFDVDRVWKGPVTKQFAIYSVSRSAEPFEPTPGTKYLVFAETASEEERLRLGLRERSVFVVRHCASGTRRWEHVSRDELTQLGRGTSPRSR